MLRSQLALLARDTVDSVCISVRSHCFNSATWPESQPKHAVSSLAACHVLHIGVLTCAISLGLLLAFGYHLGQVLVCYVIDFASQWTSVASLRGNAT